MNEDAPAPARRPPPRRTSTVCPFCRQAIPQPTAVLRRCRRASCQAAVRRAQAVRGAGENP